MTGQANMTSDKIVKTTQSLKERGLPENSYFRVVFLDGSEIDEMNTNWSLLSEKKVVKYFGKEKVVHSCKYPVKSIEAFHEGLNKKIEIPEGCEAYQAIRGDTILILNYKRLDRVIGRIIGFVKNGEVIEEYFLNGLSNNVEGIKK